MSRADPTNDPFRAIADPTRRAVLDLLRAGERPVREITKCFRITQPAMSQHLRVLKSARLVTYRRVGRERLYRLRPQELRTVADWVRQYEAFWRQKLDALGAYLENKR